MEEDLFKKLEKYLSDNFSELFFHVRKNFIGCKFTKKDKYYILYIFEYKKRVFLAYRENINFYYTKRYDITSLELEVITNKIFNLLNTSINNKPDIIIQSNKKKKVKVSKLNNIYEFNQNYNNLKIYDLIISNDVCKYLINNNINYVNTFLNIDTLKNNDINVNIKKKIEKLKYNLMNDDKIYFLNNYKFLMKSSFKYKFNNEDYDKYIDFGLCIGSLTMELVENITALRNIEIFYEYMNFTSKANLTLRDVAKKYDVSHGRIRDIVNNILKKIKLYKGEYILLFKSINTNEVLNYLIIGIMGCYNKNFLKFILEIFDLDIYDDIIYFSKTLREYLKVNGKINFYSDRDARIYNLINFSLNIFKDNKKVFKSFTVLRNVDSTSSFSGSIKLKKSKGEVEFESFSEKKVLKMLDSCSFVKEIKTQSLIIPFKSSSNHYKYYPDIQVLTKDGRVVIIEVKPLFYMMSKDSIFKYNLLKDYANKHGFGYAFMDDRFNTFDSVLKFQISKEKEEKFICYLKEKKYLDYKLYREYVKNNMMKEKEVVTIVINNQDKIEFISKPFKFRYIGKI